MRSTKSTTRRCLPWRFGIGKARLIDNRVLSRSKRGRSAVDEGTPKIKTRWSDSLRRYFLAGLLVFLPVAITLWFIGWVIGFIG